MNFKKNASPIDVLQQFVVLISITLTACGAIQAGFATARMGDRGCVKVSSASDDT